MVPVLSPWFTTAWVVPTGSSEVATPAQSKPDIKNSSRVLIKLSGEALQGERAFGIDIETVSFYAREIVELQAAGYDVAVVVGGGNMLRGRELVDAGVDRTSADHIGMLSTVMNCLALQDSMENCGVVARVMSALSIHSICEDYIRRRAIRHLEKNRIVLLAAGTGNPYFTTDTAACLRAIEIGANLVVKATKVDGIYSSDPGIDQNARHYSHLSYDQVLQQRLEVMDATAIALCRDNDIPLRVVSMHGSNALLRGVRGEAGSLIDNVADNSGIQAGHNGGMSNVT